MSVVFYILYQLRGIGHIVTKTELQYKIFNTLRKIGLISNDLWRINTNASWFYMQHTLI